MDKNDNEKMEKLQTNEEGYYVPTANGNWSQVSILY